MNRRNFLQGVAGLPLIAAGVGAAIVAAADPLVVPFPKLSPAVLNLEKLLRAKAMLAAAPVPGDITFVVPEFLLDQMEAEYPWAKVLPLGRIA